MSHVEHVRPVAALWLQAHDVLCGPPDRWLPQPLSISGTERFKGKLRVLGVAVDLEYFVQSPWREGETVMRHVVLAPVLASLGRIECEILLEATTSGPLRVTYRADSDAADHWLANLLGPPVTRLLLRRFVTVVTSRLERAANWRPEPNP